MALDPAPHAPEREPGGCIDSEVGHLRRVILHRPGRELARLTPENKQELLFDELPWLERAQEEHDALAELLRSRGVEVLYLRSLLAEVLELEEPRHELIAAAPNRTALDDALVRRLTAWLRELPARELADTLIEGITCSELRGIESVSARIARTSDFAIRPLPNQLFMRDSSAWIGSCPYVGQMARAPRRREAIHMKTIYRHHPQLGGIVDDRLVAVAPLEGGDVLVPAPGVVLLGVGSRTSAGAAERLAGRLFLRGDATQVLVAVLPERRATMHLDTVLSMLDRDAVTLYPPVVDAMPVFRVTPGHESAWVQELGGLVPALERALGTRMRVVETGGDDFRREREQWDDANNVLAIAPGLVVSYDRNTATNRRLAEAGVEVLTIPGSEIGRGRGGPRCLSCAVERAPLFASR